MRHPLRLRRRRPVLLRVTRPQRDEAGFAMLTVIISMFVLTLLAVVALDVATRGIKVSRQGQDHASAQEAERAGAQDLLHHLQAVDTYWQDPAKPACPHTSDVNNKALGAGNWATLAGTQTDKTYNDSEQYSYQFLPAQDCTVASYQSEIILEGQVLAKVTGRSRGQTVTSYVRFQKTNFLENAYISDKETLDPALYPEVRGTPATTAGAGTVGTACNQHYYSETPAAGRYATSFPSWQSAYGVATACVDPRFNGTDSIDGPVQTHDALLISGKPKLSTNAVTGWNIGDVPNPTSTSRIYRALSGSYTTDKPTGGAINYQAQLPLPESNQQLAALADKSQGGTGCYYVGPTQIVFKSDGTMDVTSPYTTQDAVSRLNAACYKGTLPSAYPTYAAKDTSVASKNVTWNVPIPANGIVWVENPTDANPTKPAPVCPVATNPINTSTTIPLNGLLNLHSDNTLNKTASYPYVDPAGPFDVGGSTISLPMSSAVINRGAWNPLATYGMPASGGPDEIVSTPTIPGASGGLAGKSYLVVSSSATVGSLLSDTTKFAPLTGSYPLVSDPGPGKTPLTSLYLTDTAAVSPQTPAAEAAAGAADAAALNNINPLTRNFTLNAANGYDCTGGDLFVEGVVKGRVTAGSANDITLTANLTYNDKTADILGLVSRNNTRVYNPTTCTNYLYVNDATNDSDFSKKLGASGLAVPVCAFGTKLPVGFGASSAVIPNSTTPDATIQAAIVAGDAATNHGMFFMDNYWINTGTARGKINLLGAIVQVFRGPMSSLSGTTIVGGYDKAYAYDTRMAFAPPPSLANANDAIQRPWQIGTESNQRPGS